MSGAIQVGPEWRIAVDAHSYAVERSRTVQKTGRQYWTAKPSDGGGGYYGTLPDAYRGLVRHFPGAVEFEDVTSLMKQLADLRLWLEEALE